jgi:2-polyprenyl-6-methoxyphenol hydroxylase-like FAD-dependent oxidoreductase
VYTVHRKGNDMDVLVSGAGIGGPALAYWLRRYGFRPTVVERAPGIRAGGQAVDLRGAGREVAERMGILPAVRAASLDERGFAYVNRAGKPVARMPADMFGGEGIVAEIEILRGDLAHILYDAARQETEYLFDDSITGLSQVEDGVRVTFERAAPRTFDLVVGADGMHSRVRALAFGEESRFVRSFGAYTSYFTLPYGFDSGGWMQFYPLPGRRVAGIRSGGEHGAQAMFSFAAPPLTIGRSDVDAQKRILADRFAGVGWLVPRMLDAMWEAPDFYFDLYGQVHMESWVNGRVVLLGDAGYCASPLTGLGTSLALVGAYVLAGELASAPDHATGLRRYEEEMRGYVKQAQQLPPGGIKGFLPKSQAAIGMRNVSTRMMLRWPLRNLMAKAFQKADAITLKDYGATDGLRPASSSRRPARAERAPMS